MIGVHVIVLASLQGQHYAVLSDKPTSIMTPDGHQKTEYAIVIQQPSKPTSDEGVDPDEEALALGPNECSKKSRLRIPTKSKSQTLVYYSS